MMVCPECRKEISISAGSQISCSCGASFTKVNGIWEFEKGYEERFQDHTRESIEALLKHADKHFWLLERKRQVISQITQYLKPNDRFLDVGSGAGDIATKLRGYGLDISISDIQRISLECGEKLGFENIFQFDLYKPIFVNHFQGIGSFDVIEHLDDDVNAVSNLLSMTAPGGYIFATVPAFKILWNNRDIMERHKRRYDKKQLTSLFLNQGAQIVSCRYIFFSIFPLLLIRVLLCKLFPKSDFSAKDYQSQFEITNWTNKTLNFFLRNEDKCFSKTGPPFGGSLLIVARKPLGR